jgi:hypothetical protein
MLSLQSHAIISAFGSLPESEKSTVARKLMFTTVGYSYTMRPLMDCREIFVWKLFCHIMATPTTVPYTQMQDLLARLGPCMHAIADIEQKTVHVNTHPTWAYEVIVNGNLNGIALVDTFWHYLGAYRTGPMKLFVNGHMYA